MYLDKMGAPILADPFYMGSKGGKNAHVVTPHFNGIPRRGMACDGQRFLQQLEGPAALECIREFTATIYSGAMLLQHLAVAQPQLGTSIEACRVTLSNMERRRRLFLGVDDVGVANGTRLRSGRAFQVRPYFCFASCMLMLRITPVG